MTDLVYDYLTTGVDMVICGAILSSIIMLLYTSAHLSVSIVNNQSTSESLAYYMQFNQFDDKTTYASDAISSLIKYADDMEVIVRDESNNVILYTNGDGNIYKPGSTPTPVRKNASTLSIFVTGEHEYKSELVSIGESGGIGTVQGIIFTAIAKN